MRALLQIGIQEQLRRKRWTDAQAAERLGITQPRVSKLRKGVWQDFSLDMLMTLTGRRA